MKVLLYKDGCGASQVWQNCFAEILSANDIPYLWVSFDRWRKRPRSGEGYMKLLRKYYEPGDYFVCRFNTERHRYLIDVYKKIVELFGDDHVFPRYASFWYYDDKRRQMETFKKHGYHVPAQGWIENQNELQTWMDKHKLHFPLVRKENTGASSTGVSLLEGFDNAQYPFLVQDYWKNNDCDMRVNIIGSYAMTYKRLVRKDDFRASGSGMLEYPEDVPLECMELAYRISKDHGFDCMSYDLIRDHVGKWGVLEMSYTFIDRYVTGVPWYYDCENGFYKHGKTELTPEYFILKNLLREQIQKPAKTLNAAI